MNKELLEKFILEGKSTYIISKELKKSSSTIIYYIKKYDLCALYKSNSKYTKNNNTKDIWQETTLLKIIPNCFNYSEILNELGIVPRGHNFRTLQKYITKYNIDISHFKSKKSVSKFKRTTEEILNNSFQCKSTDLKNRLYNENYKVRECELCGQNETWNGKKMSLILDHIDGNHLNNFLNNLRIVCPNCNATLDTHCGKHKSRKIVFYCKCGNKKHKNSLNCKNCNYLKNKNNINLEILKTEVFKIPMSILCKKYKLSDKGLAKICKKNNINTPNRGYWSKLKTLM